jgi:tRNA-2-methylthio-N6-dimethylallyladenosine synthase|tara:strand:+ start:7173 stop:8465 length:1293 start_codon:yes stop_codon:yes gene_type:complete
MNEYDSNRIFDIVKGIGYEKSDDQKNADCYIINTCHIRDKANEKVFHEVGRIKKIYSNKNKPIMIIAGCVAQAENKEMLKREPYIDVVIGPQSYHKINNILNNIQKNKKEDETEFDTIAKFDLFEKTKNSDSKVSAFLTIQEGCDKFCHFCVVPYTRGPECSRSFKTIINEAEDLIKNGVKEITLLGQNVNAYSFKEKNIEYKISNLLNELEKYSELKRIRYTTSHPVDMTDDLIDCYSSNKKLMPFIHLPIQSGSNKVLKLMNRKHKVENYLDIYNKLMKINPLIKISSDFIVGYPGEEKFDFEQTIKLVKEIKFINSFSFIFSPRPGTKASKLGELNNSISKERLIELQSYLFKNQIDHNKSLENKEIYVLVENKIKNQNKFFGRNEYLNSVIFNCNKDDIGKIVKVNVENSNQNTLFGKINNKMKAA